MGISLACFVWGCQILQQSINHSLIDKEHCVPPIKSRQGMIVHNPYLYVLAPLNRSGKNCQILPVGKEINVCNSVSELKMWTFKTEKSSVHLSKLFILQMKKKK